MNLASLVPIGITAAVASAAAAVAIAAIWRTESWPSVRGEITRSEIEVVRTARAIDSGSYDREYKAVIEYTYTVDGRSYTSGRVFGVLPTVFSKRSEAAQLVAKYPVGATPDVHHHPTDPARATLVHGGSAAKRGLIAFACLACLVGIAIAAAGYFLGRASLGA